MNIGECKNRPKYICDKCGQVIPYVYQKGFVVNKYYKQKKYDYVIKKEFDLCDSCKKELEKWLKQKSSRIFKNIIDDFPRWEE